MQLKRSTDILLRILLHLASHPERDLISIQDLSTELNWNKNLVVKVSHLAVQQGLLTAARGRTGGLALAKPLSEYRIGDIVRLSEGDESLVNCGDPFCPLLAGGCRLRSLLDNAREKFYQELNAFTLADLASAKNDSTSVVRFFEPSIAA